MPALGPCELTHCSTLKPAYKGPDGGEWGGRNSDISVKCEISENLALCSIELRKSMRLAVVSLSEIVFDHPFPHLSIWHIVSSYQDRDSGVAIN